jgi:hypothetical protein
MNDSTRNGGPLSLAERAKHGLLPDSLSIPEIAELEHPTDLTARAALEAALRAAIQYGDLPEHRCEYDDGLADCYPPALRRIPMQRQGRF